MKGHNYSILAQIEIDAYNEWKTIDLLDQKRSSVDYPYTHDELRFIINHIQPIIQSLESINKKDIASVLREKMQHLFDVGFSDNANQTSIVITVNAIKDILHKLWESKGENRLYKVDTSIKGFPLYKHGTKKGQYILLFGDRCTWISQVLHDKIGQEYSSAFGTTMHDFAEFTGNGSHLSYNFLQLFKENPNIKLEKKLEILEQLVHLLCSYYFSPSKESENKANILFDKLEKEYERLNK